MRAEILAVGTELLLGQIVNSNAAFLSQELNSLGIDCFYQTVVGDNKNRIKECLKIAFERANLVITTGGLGPTSDDLTVETCAEFFDTKMFLDEEALKDIKKIFERRKIHMVKSNEKQALRPLGSLIIPNPTGTAPGVIWDVTEKINKKETKILVCLPGVPSEMKLMWAGAMNSSLSQMLFEGKQLFYKELKFYGIGESALAERVQDFLDMDDPTVAPLASEGECKLRIATKAESKDEAFEKISQTEKNIIKRVGEYIYGSDSDTLESVVARLFTEKKLSLTIAESCTGGLLSKRLTDIPGSSVFFKCSIVSYSNESKEKILGVSSSLINSKGAVSEEVAEEMAKGALKLSGSDISISITGIAGPTGDTPDKPLGLVFVSFCWQEKNSKEIFTKNFRLDFGNAGRNNVRYRTTQECLNLLRKHLLEI